MKYQLRKSKKCSTNCQNPNPVDTITDLLNDNDINAAYRLCEDINKKYKDRGCSDCEVEVIEAEN